MNLRSRLILSYIVVITICLGLVALVFAVAARSYSDRVTIERLREISVPIYVEARSLSAAQPTIRDVWESLEAQATESNVAILLLGKEGRVLRAASPFRTQIEQLEVPDTVLTATETTSGAWKAPSGQTFVFVSYPTQTLGLSSGGGTTVYHILIATPRRGVLATWGLLLRPLAWAGLVAFVVSLVLAAAIGRSFYRPVQRVTEAAQQIADGTYDLQVPVEGPPELKRMAKAFNTMASQVRVSQQRLRDFVADVSHELKSPLTSINGFAQALLDGTAADESTRVRAAEIIRDQSRRVASQVDELLDLSRIQAGRVSFSMETVDVGDVVNRAVEVFGFRADECGMAIARAVQPGLRVRGDSDRLEQVVSNLLDNALKHAPQGSTVGLSASQDGTWIEVSVTDEGPGIPEDKIEHVFERFYQGTGVRTGAGLGLAIAREIVVAHGGSISVANARGSGAVFTVRLPAAPAEAD